MTAQTMTLLVVGDLLEGTIARTTAAATGATASQASAVETELAWLRKRLDNERRDPRSRGKLALEADRNSSSSGRVGGNDNQQQARSGVKKGMDHVDKENGAAAMVSAPTGPRPHKVSPSDMSVLQLRRLLRAIGQPTAGLKPTLTARLETAISSGVLKTFVDRVDGQPLAAVECAGERRRTQTLLAMAKSMLSLDSSSPTASDTTVSKLPLRESLSGTNNDLSSRSAAGNGGQGKAQQQHPPATPATSKLLSGQEQDAVVAKIRSAAKRSASPEKKLPYQDDDTPNTKGARLKKEMEDRLARQRATKKLQQQPAPSTPSAEAERLPTPATPPSQRPPVPASPAPMPPTSPSRTTQPPPPPMADAPHPDTPAAPPAPEGSAPRPADLTKSTEAPTTPTTPTTTGVLTSGSSGVPASPTEAAPVPTGADEKGVAVGGVDDVAGGIASLSANREGQSAQLGAGGGVGAGKPVEQKPTSPSKGFGSPGRHKGPSTKTPARKANPYAKDSIASAGPSGLKAAAHKAFNRMGGKPAPNTEVPSPTGSSTTQDAFAKFRAMDSNSKKGAGSVQSFKSRLSPSPKKQPPAAGSSSGQMPPPQKLDFGVGSKASSSNIGNNNGSSRPVSSFKQRAGDGGDAGLSGFSATKAAAKAKSEAAAAAKVKTLAEQAAADEARREAQARAELKTKEAALKAATEREEKIRKEEERRKREAERKRQAEKRAAERLAERAAAAEALRKAEEKKRAEKRAAMEQAAAAARKEEQEAAAEEKRAAELKRAAEQKRAAEAAAAAAAAAEATAAATKSVKPPTPPRAGTKPPPTPPRPMHGHKGQVQAPPPPTPPRPLAAMAAAQAPPASPWTPSKPTAAEARQLALAKKKEEIAKRMEETRNKKTKAATPVPAPAPAPAPAPPAPAAKFPAATKPAPAPVQPTPAAETKEERESYDAYDVEPESGSESCDEEEEAAPEIQEPREPSDKSAIPDWARGKALAKILDKQYGGPNPLNPDKIFPEFFTCNLEHIFNTKKQKWDRSSSGNWHTDRLTIAEKLAYQRAMGFDK